MIFNDMKICSWRCQVLAALKLQERQNIDQYDMNYSYFFSVLLFKCLLIHRWSITFKLKKGDKNVIYKIIIFLMKIKFYYEISGFIICFCLILND